MKQFYCMGMVALLSVLPLGAAAESKVLLVGLDGVQYSRVRELRLPVLGGLQSSAAYTAGIIGTSSEVRTDSGPGWTTVLTGVWADKHGVRANDTPRADPVFPSVFKRVRSALPGTYIASLASWAPINTQFFVDEGIKFDRVLSGRSDEETTVAAIDTLRNASADLVFVHLSGPDGAHEFCFGSRYDEALRVADQRLGRLLDVVKAREKGGEDWLVLVTTDHGRTPPKGCHHGGQTREEKEVFIATNRTLNREFQQEVAAPDPALGGLYNQVPATAIMPTILRHLGISLQPGWLLDGPPLLGEPGVRKLMDLGGKSAGKLCWAGDADGRVEIWRDGQHVGEASYNTRHWSDPQPKSGSTDYTLVHEGTPVSIRSIRTTGSLLD